MSFISYKDGYMNEMDNRKDVEFDKLCKYYVKCLDDSLKAIAPKDLIILTASSGAGKSELALHISRNNAMAGKKVAHYNLEGGWEEGIQRMKWRDMCDLYYREYHTKGQYTSLDYTKWVLNKGTNPLLDELENRVFTNLMDNMGGNLFLYDNPQGLNCERFCESLVKLEGLRCDLELDANIRNGLKGIHNINLIVIDHLHYFSLTKDEREIQEITNILKTAKKITQELHIPVILVAHLRKLPRGHGIPDKEDIYGTSNIHKIANTCIVLAPDHDNDDEAGGLFPTYIRIAKSRQGLRPHTLMYTTFNIHERKYLPEYSLYKCYPDGSVDKEPISYNRLPAWAKIGAVSGYTKYGGDI